MPISTSVLDDANRADEAPTVDMSSGDVWTDFPFYAAGSLKVVSNQLAGNAVSGRRGAYDSSRLPAADQEVYVTKQANPTNDTERIDSFLRLLQPGVAANTTGYLHQWGFVSATADTWKIFRRDANLSVQIGSTGNSDLANADKIRFEAIGSAISVYKIASGGVETQITTATDTTYNNAGNMAIGIDSGPARIDDFGGGSIVSGTAMPPRNNPLMMKIAR